jgi:hypothetical protein
VDNGDGTYSASYTTGDNEGVVFVNVHIYGKEIKGVPVRLNISKGACAEQCTAEGPGVEEGFVGRPNRFKVIARDSDGVPLKTGGDDFQPKVTGPNGENIPVRLCDNGDGTYSAQYSPLNPGPHTVEVELVKAGDAKSIKDCPKTCNVRKGAKSNMSYMTGKGLRWAYEGRDNTFMVYAFDEDGNPVAGESVDLIILTAEAYDENDASNKLLRDTTSAEYADYQKNFDELAEEKMLDTSTLTRATVASTVKDNGNGTYTVTFQPTRTGAHVIDCRLYDEHVRKSPARLTVYFNCPHKQCQDAMAALHNELDGLAEQTEDQKASIKAIAEGKEHEAHSDVEGLKQQLADEQTARQAAEDEIARLKALLAEANL